MFATSWEREGWRLETREIVHRIEELFQDAVVSAADEGSFAFVEIKPDRLKAVMSSCVNDPALRLDMLECMTARDLGAEIAVIYHLRSVSLSHRLNVKATVSRHAPSLTTVSAFWRSAVNCEREAAEMLGIEFEGHPLPQKLLLPEDWHGFPLRKDYTYPEEYHDLVHRREPLRKEHVRP